MAQILWLGTYSSDPTNFAAASNWDGGVPAGGDDIIFSAEYNNDCTTGVDQGTTAFNSIVVEPGYSATIGAVGGALISEPGKFEYHGSGVMYVDLSSASVAVVITNSGSTASGKYGVYLQGTITTLSISGGRVSVATLAGESAAVTALRISAGVCVVGSNTSSLGSVDITGGSVITRESVATVRQYAGIFSTGDAAAITTKATIYGGRTVLNGSGTIVSLLLNGDGEVDTLQNGVARTITLFENLGGSFSYDPTVLTITGETTPDRAVRVSVSTI